MQTDFAPNNGSARDGDAEDDGDSSSDDLCGEEEAGGTLRKAAARGPERKASAPPCAVSCPVVSCRVQSL